MKNLSLLFIIGLFVCGMNPIKNQQESIEILEGKVKQKPWAKSSQSYCAQGSRFYVLETETAESLVLAFDESEFTDKLAEIEGNIVKIRGERKTKRIKHSKDPFSQHPVTTDINGNEIDYFECTVFEIIEIF